MSLNLSETHYSLKEMETTPLYPDNVKKTLHVGNPLLSERDGNSTKFIFGSFIVISGRKPTTLWKRWKPVSPCDKPMAKSSMSETHYSLKEMETLEPMTNALPSSLNCRKPTTLWKRWKQAPVLAGVYHFGYIVGNPLLSERDGNSSTVMRHEFGISSVGNPLLSERDGNPSTGNLGYKQGIFVGNPLLSERDGNPAILLCCPLH